MSGGPVRTQSPQTAVHCTQAQTQQPRCLDEVRTSKCVWVPSLPQPAGLHLLMPARAGEDFYTSWWLIANGWWKNSYVRVPMQTGLIPWTAEASMVQHRRWVICACEQVSHSGVTVRLPEGASK